MRRRWATPIRPPCAPATGGYGSPQTTDWHGSIQVTWLGTSFRRRFRFFPSAAKEVVEPISSAVKFAAGTHTVEIVYTGLSLSIPERVEFRYKLEGTDADWQNVGTRRQADYSNLGPGSYRFRVIARNNDGVWNDTGARIDFSIAPTFYQTAWFRISCLAVFLVLAWASYHLRIQQLHHQFTIGLEARVKERTRIARELHDTLLQSFQGVTLLFQRARNLLPERAAEAMQTLDNALDGADQALAEGRDAIHDLRSPASPAKGLAEEITALTEELVAQDGDRDPVQSRVVIEGSAQTLHPDVHMEVFRIAREALRNAFSHSEGRRIETEIAYSDSLFRLRIRDDGKGIEPNVRDRYERTGHWGLRGMRERTERLGGELNLWSEPGAGTEVELRIPGSIAYERASARNSLRYFGKR